VEPAEDTPIPEVLPATLAPPPPGPGAAHPETNGPHRRFSLFFGSVLRAKAEAEAAFAAAWEGGKRAEVFAAAARVGWAVTDSSIELTLLLPSSSVYETFAKRVEGIAALEARIAAAARPVTAATLTGLGGLFGGAVVVKKSR
jgi:hypothetical protein